MNYFKTQILPYLIYPLTMGLSVCAYLILIQSDINFLISTYLPLTIAGITVALFEYYFPYQKNWGATKDDIKEDVLFMLFTQIIFSKFLTFFTAIIILKLLNNYQLIFKDIWPHYLPVFVQGIFMVLIIDFFRYWLHRASHNTNLLWRLHAVHHSPKKLYWLNVGRFHPIERSIQFLIDSVPFMIIGVGQEVIAMYFLLFAVNGFFQHCNIHLKYGLLNYIVSSAELHRWHHSKNIEESNSNYSNTTIIWDIVFGTHFLPKNKEVNELGLINSNYPLDFFSQMKTPFIKNIDKKLIPILSFKEIIINLLLKIRMQLLYFSLYYPLKIAAKNPWKHQEKILFNILSKNKKTIYGQNHKFNEINNYQSFKDNIPINTYDDLKPYIEKQENTKLNLLTSELPIIYNQTSGTTGTPKYIPILNSTLKQIKKYQNLFSYIQYKTIPEGFNGKLLGIVSPAIEGHLITGTSYGSASGLIYKNMPSIARSKYVIPYEVFEITDYTIKYYVIIRLALTEKNITYIGSANPSTFIRMIEIIKSHKNELLEDIKKGTIKYIDQIDSAIVPKIKNNIRPNRKRAEELEEIMNHNEISFSSIWPYIKIVTTWTGGSCGIALNRIKSSFPNEAVFFELGYLSSELRGTITINGTSNIGIPTFQYNFFEFVEKENWENNRHIFLTLNQIEINKEYYIFITTDSGLYRYHMNDIIKVTDFFENTPTFKFIQKGKGVVNITGEKLYESQVYNALNEVETNFKFNSTFYQMLGNEEERYYEIYLEADFNSSININELEIAIDTTLSKINLEYSSKRSGERLKPLKLFLLKKGTFENYKKHCLSKGQKESQFKTVALLPKKDFHYTFDEDIIN